MNESLQQTAHTFKATYEHKLPETICSEDIFGEVDLSELVLPCDRAFLDIDECLKWYDMDPETNPDEPHAGATVFVTDVPEVVDMARMVKSDEGHEEVGNISQDTYIKQLAKVLTIRSHARAKAQDSEYKPTGKPVKYLVIDVKSSTSSIENKDVTLDVINSFGQEKTQWAVFIKDELLNMKNADGEDILDESGEPLPDTGANERLAEIREALDVVASKDKTRKLIAINVLPEGYPISEPTKEELRHYLDNEAGHPEEVTAVPTFTEEDKLFAIDRARAVVGKVHGCDRRPSPATVRRKDHVKASTAPVSSEKPLF